MENAKREYPQLAYVESAVAAVQSADVVLHLTEWQEFRDLGPDEIGKVVKQKNILDGRNALDPEQWRTAGWTFRALGRK